MTVLPFDKFLFESGSDNLPAEVRLAKLGLGPGLNVLEWWTDKESESSSILTVFFIGHYAWPESSDDDFVAEVNFDIQSSLGFVEKRMMSFAKQSDLDWIHDMERDTWKRVNR